MSNLSITACSFSIREFNSKSVDKIYPLNSTFKAKYKDVKTEDIFLSFINKYNKSIKNEDRKQTLRCKYNKEFIGETDNYKYIYTIITSGYYGDATTIVNVDTNEETYNKRPNEAEIRDFYLFIILPKDTDKVKVNKGMLIFQNTGVFGVKTITSEYMNKFFRDEYNLKLRLSTISSNLFLDKTLKKENITKMIMTRNHVSGDVSDNVGNGYGYGVESRMLKNLNFNDSLWNSIIKKLKDISKSKSSLFEFEDKKYDNVKTVVKIGKKERTINIHNLENLSIIEELPSGIKGVDGIINESKLKKHIEDVADEYLSEMVLQIKK